MKYLLVMGLFAGLLTLGACSSVDAESEVKGETVEEKNRIEPSAAIDIAEEVAGGKLVKWELDDNEYEVKMFIDDVTYEIEIDAVTSEVLRIDEEAESEATGQTDKSHLDGSGSKGAADLEKLEKETADKDEKHTGALESDENEALTKGDALEIAKNNVDGESHQWEIERDDDKYEIALKSGGSEYDIEVDTASGEIIKFEQEDDDYKEHGKTEAHKTDAKKEQSNGAVTSEKAIRIAKDAVDGRMIEWEYDEDDYEYEVEMLVNGEDIEVEINAKSGNVIEIDD